MKHFIASTLLLLCAVTSALGQDKVDLGISAEIDLSVNGREYHLDKVVSDVREIPLGAEITFTDGSRAFVRMVSDQASKMSAGCTYAEPYIEFSAPASLVSTARYEFSQTAGSAKRGSSDFTVTAFYYTSATATNTDTAVSVVWFQYDTGSAGTKLVALANYTDTTVGGSQCRARQTTNYAVIPAGGGNTPPVATASSQTLAEDTERSFTLVATDADGDPLAYSIVSSPANGAVTIVADKATYTPAANFNGSDSFSWKASDGAAESNTVTVSITVLAVNDSPAFVGQCVSALVQGVSYSCTPEFSDVDGGLVTITQSGVIPPGLTWNGISITGIPTTPGGPWVTVFTISDGELAVTQSVAFHASAAPAVDTDGDGVPDSSDNCPAVSNPSQSDMDGDGVGDVCDTVDNRDDDGDGVNNTNDLCAATPSGEAVNSSGCSASQLDSDNDGVNDAVDQCPGTPAGVTVNTVGCAVVVTPTNQPPVITVSGLLAEYAAGITVGNIQVHATDPEDGDLLPGDITITVYDANQTTVIGFFGSVPVSGIYRVNVRATDSEGLSAEKNYAVRILSLPGIVDPTCSGVFPGVLSAGQTFTATLTCLNPAGVAGVPTYVLNLPAWATFSQSGGTLTITGTTPVTPGTYPIGVTVTNGVGGSSDQSFVITVSGGTSTNHPPVFGMDGTVGADGGSLPVGVTLYPNVTDPDGDTVTIWCSRVSGSGPVTFTAVADPSTCRAVFGTLGEYTLRVWASDGTVTVYKDVTVVVGVNTSVDDADVPEEYTLLGNYPNPFNPTTTIGFALPQGGTVQLTVVNAVGQPVFRGKREFSPGKNEWRFDAARLPSGNYFYRIDSTHGALTGSMLLVK